MTEKMLTRTRIITATACAMALAAQTAPAFAQTSSESGYDETGVLSAIGGSSLSSPGAAGDAPSPAFTGAAPRQDYLGVAAESSDRLLLGEVERGVRSDGVRGAVAGHSEANLPVASSGNSFGSRSSLPFTGRDLIVVALLGLLLVAIGAALRIGGAQAGLNVPVRLLPTDERQPCRR